MIIMKTQLQESSDIMPPPHWPSDVQYLHISVFHPSVPKTTRLLIKGTSPKKIMDKDPQHRPPVAIRKISSVSHPACGQYGLFATKKIPPKSYIIEYIGEIHCEDRPSSDYDLSLYRACDRVNVGVDASKMGNEARFINDYRGVTAKPNALFSEIKAPLGGIQMGIWSSGQEIKKGEEILVSYGKSWWRARTVEPST